MDDMDYDQLDTVELNEEINTDISFDRIKSIAMNGIADANKNSKKQRKRLSRLVIIPAAAIITLMSITAFALTTSEAFRAFFDDSIDFIVGKTQDVQKTDTKNGITFTVESAVIDDTSGLIIFSFVKEDGTAFDKNTAIADIKLSTGDGNGYSRELKFTDDYKKLLYYIDPINDGKLYGKMINITVQNLIADIPGERQADVSLSELYKMNPFDIDNTEPNKTAGGSATDEKSVKVPIALNDLDSANAIVPIYELPQYRIIGAGFVDGKLTIASQLHRPYGNSSSDADIYKLIDTRTGEIINSTGAARYFEERTKTEISQVFFDVSDIERLKYLKPVISYNIKSIIVEGEWSVDFKLQKNMDMIKLTSKAAFDEENNDEIYTVTINEINISVVGVNVKGVSIGKSSATKKIPLLKDSYILMNDGKVNKFKNSSAEFDGKDGFSINFRIADFIDVKNIKSIFIAGHEFPVK
jgi:hypothetical protein